MEKPEGNPDKMRAMATQCKGAGEKIDASVHKAAYTVRDMIFHCPAATRVRNSVTREANTQASLAKSLKRFAIDLDKAAGVLETELKMYHAQVEAAASAKAHNDRVDIANGKKSVPAPTLDLAPNSVFSNAR
ncbi:MAG: hypothetical protein Q7T55_16265 [Solirubrobacteraceae bacterium]|nr:hypothetical protein [Solirubrobacteraceae bacterium]